MWISLRQRLVTVVAASALIMFQLNDFEVSETFGIMVIAGVAMQRGQCGQRNAPVEPKEKDAQGQLGTKSGEQGYPLVTVTKGRDHIKPRVTTEQGPSDDDQCGEYLASVPRRPGREKQHGDERRVETGPQEPPVTGVILRRQGESEEHRPRDEHRGAHEEEHGDVLSAP